MHIKTPSNHKAFTQEEAFEASLRYFSNDDLAARVWINKYALKDSDGNLFESSPNDMHKRIGVEVVLGTIYPIYALKGRKLKIQH